MPVEAIKEVCIATNMFRAIRMPVEAMKDMHRAHHSRLSRNQLATSGIMCSLYMKSKTRVHKPRAKDKTHKEVYVVMPWQIVAVSLEFCQEHVPTSLAAFLGCCLLHVLASSAFSLPRLYSGWTMPRIRSVSYS
jgi:hypothetical protein